MVAKIQSDKTQAFLISKKVKLWNILMCTLEMQMCTFMCTFCAQNLVLPM